MTSTDPLSDSFVCLARGHAGCTQENRNGELWVTHWPASALPADDVREALIDAMIDVEVSGGMVEFGKDDRAEAAYLADAILTAPGIEVRPRGTVTDAEVEAAGRHLGMEDGMEHWIDRDSVRAALEAAAEARNA